MSNKKILIMAGGTGGHVFPGLALAEEMKDRGYQVEWLGTANGLESKLVPAANIPLHLIPVRGVRGKGLRDILMAPWNIFSSLLESRSILKSHRPHLVVGLGGFVAAPGGIAAKLLGLPLLIHEQNAVAGTTNKLLAKIAAKVLTAFPDVLENSVVIGNPVRREIELLTDPERRGVAQRSTINVLVIGGSRGAQAINKLVPHALSLLPRRDEISVWHQAGANNETQTIRVYDEVGVSAKVNAFIDDMAKALAWADIAICRSGALTVSELSAAGLGAIFIPFPYAIDDHQTANAKFLESAEAAIIKQQSELSEESLAEVLAKVIFDREKLLSMAKQARSQAKPRAAKMFADYCEALVHD